MRFPRPTLRLLEPWRTRLLWFSLAVNMFALPMLLAPHVWHRHPGGPSSFDSLVSRMAGNLTTADADRFRGAMARERPWYDLSRQDLLERRESVARQVETEPYDPAAVRAALVQMQGTLRDAAGRFDDSLVLAMKDLSPEGRTALADALRRRRR